MYNKDFLLKVWSFFSVKRKKATIWLSVLMILNMFFETFGIGIIIPIVSLLTDPKIIQNQPWIEPILNWAGNPSTESLIILAMLSLVLFYTFRALFMLFLSWQQAKFAAEFQTELSKSLFTQYIHQSYFFHMNRNSAELIRNSTVEVNTTVSMVQQSFSLITELLTLIGAACLLLYVEPIGALVVLCAIVLAGGLLHLGTRKRMLAMGYDRQKHEEGRLLYLQQGLAGFKDIKLYGREETFINQYQEQSEACARVVKNYTVMLALPRLFLEYLAIIGLSGLVISIILQGKPISQVVPILGLFAAAAFRLMPSVHRMLTVMQNVKYSLPTIDLLYEELQIPSKRDLQGEQSLIPFSSNIQLTNVTFKYAEKDVISNCSLTLEKGRTYGFIGESGSGKSTLIDLVLGMLSPNSGKVCVDSKNIHENLRGWQSQLGYVPQSIYLTDDTIRRNIAFGKKDDEIDEPALESAIDLAQLENFINSSPQGLDIKVGERGVRLSGGQLQRIGIARALYNKPSVLILDEATSSLDLETEKEVMDAISAMHGTRTIIIIAHRLSTLESCDVIYRVDKGQVKEQDKSRMVFSN